MPQNRMVTYLSNNNEGLSSLRLGSYITRKCQFLDNRWTFIANCSSPKPPLNLESFMESNEILSTTCYRYHSTFYILKQGPKEHQFLNIWNIAIRFYKGRHHGLYQPPLNIWVLLFSHLPFDCDIFVWNWSEYKGLLNTTDTDGLVLLHQDISSYSAECVSRNLWVNCDYL